MPSERNTGSVTPVIDKAYILGDGKVVTKAYVDSYRVRNKEMTKQEQKSKQITDDPFDYQKEDAIPPPFNLTYLTQLLSLNTDHYRCVQAKATDVSGLGFDIVKDPKSKTEPKDVDRDVLLAFFGDCNDDMTFQDILKNVDTDFEATGNGYMEVARNAKGDPAKLWHLPSLSARVMRQEKGFIQKKSNKTRFFQSFGEKYDREHSQWKPMNSATGAIEQKLSYADAANEILHFKLYHPSSLYYGIPDFIPAVTAIVGNQAVADYNLQFFDHNAVPQYAIVIEGASLTPGLIQLIQRYFETEIKGHFHKTFVLPIPSKNVTVKFERLAVDVKDSSWQMYRKDNRDEIVRAHGVHPARIGIIETASLGAGTGLSQQECYKNTIVEPRQTTMEYRITRSLIRMGFGIEGWNFKFTDLDIRDKKSESEIARTYLEKGVWTINMVLESQGLPTTPGGDRRFIIAAGGPMFVDEFGDPPDDNVEKMIKGGASLDFVRKALEFYIECHPKSIPDGKSS